LAACVSLGLQAIGERTVSVKSQAKGARRARRQSKSDRFGQAPRIEVVADDA
jgi:hypothetical protein